MPKKLPIFFLLSVWSHFLQGQPNPEKTKAEFRMATNDSLFIAAHSRKPFAKSVAQRYTFPHSFSPLDSVVFFQARKGVVLGPMETDSFWVYIKVLQVDSAFRMRVGNLYLNTEKRGQSPSERLANTLLEQIQKGKDFNEVCRKYTDDNNQNPNCDLGWFFQGMMDATFEKKILLHRKHDVFRVTTSYGIHLVKVLENPVQDRNKVEYVTLYLDKK